MCNKRNAEGTRRVSMYVAAIIDEGLREATTFIMTFGCFLEPLGLRLWRVALCICMELISRHESK